MSVSIIIPTYNRKRFETLLEYNINSQDYYNIKEIIILDDSDKDRPLCIRSLIPISYYTVNVNTLLLWTTTISIVLNIFLILFFK